MLSCKLFHKDVGASSGTRLVIFLSVSQSVHYMLPCRLCSHHNLYVGCVFIFSHMRQWRLREGKSTSMITQHFKVFMCCYTFGHTSHEPMSPIFPSVVGNAFDLFSNSRSNTIRNCSSEYWTTVRTVYSFLVNAFNAYLLSACFGLSIGPATWVPAQWQELQSLQSNVRHWLQVQNIKESKVHSFMTDYFWSQEFKSLGCLLFLGTFKAICLLPRFPSLCKHIYWEA
jgi:hypothetical protein